MALIIVPNQQIPKKIHFQSFFCQRLLPNNNVNKLLFLKSLEKSIYDRGTTLK